MEIFEKVVFPKIEELDVSFEKFGVLFQRVVLHHQTKDRFSGKDSYAVWLTEDSLRSLIKESGFSVFEEWETRNERNGLRVCWLLKFA